MRKPYYQDEWVTIYHGDCREILYQLPKVDLVLTDPPYKDDDVEGEYYQWFHSWKARLSFNDYFVFFNNSSRLYDLLQLYGKPYRVLVWSKGVVQYAWRWEPIFIYSSREPTFKLNRYIWSDHLPFQPIFGGIHPYEKPLDLMKMLVSFIPTDKVILDPFTGTGTTLVASKSLNRKCIGIEIEEKYCEMAANRCSQGVFDLSI
jgi:site-specific DNA-methyltransferase (adenine-specific)